jgi:hypothetical protein
MWLKSALWGGKYFAHYQSILMFPPPIVRSGVLRQGSDKFYSVSFQARHSFFVTFKSF